MTTGLKPVILMETIKKVHSEQHTAILFAYISYILSCLTVSSKKKNSLYSLCTRQKMI
jgi:hypothetical protein